MNAKTIILTGLAIMTFGCRSEKATGDSAAWWETDAGTQDASGDGEDKPDDADYGEDKPDDYSFPDCAEDFDSTATCEGGWEDTICVHDGVIWWCENGVWLNEGDK